MCLLTSRIGTVRNQGNLAVRRWVRGMARASYVVVFTGAGTGAIVSAKSDDRREVALGRDTTADGSVYGGPGFEEHRTNYYAPGRRLAVCATGVRSLSAGLLMYKYRHRA